MSPPSVASQHSSSFARKSRIRVESSKMPTKRLRCLMKKRPRSRGGSGGGALGPRRAARAHRPRAPTYGEDVMEPLRKVWAVMDAPAGKRMAPFLPEMVARLRVFGELDLDDDLAARLCSMSAATIDRRLADERARL